MKYTYILLLFLLPLLSNGQSMAWDYQLIVESKNRFTHRDKLSSVTAIP